MKIYLAYKFSGADTQALKQRLIELSNVLKKQGHETFVFFRDIQNWGKIKTDIKEVVDKATEAMKDCDMILADVSEKPNGVYYEIGVARGLEKKVVVMCEAGKEAAFLKATADEVIEYEDWDELVRNIEKWMNM